MANPFTPGALVGGGQSGAAIGGLSSGPHIHSSTVNSPPAPRKANEMPISELETDRQVLGECQDRLSDANDAVAKAKATMASLPGDVGKGAEAGANQAIVDAIAFVKVRQSELDMVQARVDGAAATAKAAAVEAQKTEIAALQAKLNALQAAT